MGYTARQFPDTPFPMRHLLILLSSALLLAACGQTGPLYLPDEAHPQTAPAESAEGSVAP